MAADSVEAIDGTFVPLVRSTVSWVEIDGESLAVNDVDGRLALLNSTAALLLECFDGSGTIDELVDDLAGAVAVPAEELRGQVIDAARRFAVIGYLEGIDVDEREEELDEFHRQLFAGLADGTLVARPAGDGLEVEGEHLDHDHDHDGHHHDGHHHDGRDHDGHDHGD